MTLLLTHLPTNQDRGFGRPRRHLPRGIERLAGVAVLFGAWELAARTGWLTPQVLAGPSTVLTAGVDMVRDGTLGHALWVSVQRVGWGFGIGVAVGAALALFAGLTRIGDDLIDGNVNMLRFVPIIGLSPLLVLWLGIGESTKVTLIALGVTFPIYINTLAGVRSLDRRYDELADVIGLGHRARLRHIVLPAVLPGFLTGLRLASSVAWLLLVFAEQINARAGLGYLMIQAQTFFQSDVIVVCLITYAALGLISNSVVRQFERRLLRWQSGR